MNVSVKVGRNMLYNAIAKFSVLLGNLVVLSIYSHYLGSEQFGIIALMSAIMLFYSLFFFGIPQTLIKQISHYDATGENEEVQRVYNNGTLAILILGTVLCLVLAFVAPHLIDAAVSGYAGKPENITFVAYVTVVNVFIYTLYTPIDSALQGFQRYGTIAIRTVISTAFGWVLMLAAVSLDTGIRGVAIATLGQPLAILVTSYLSFRTLKLKFRPRYYFNRETMRGLFSFGFPLFINDALATLLSRGDIFVIGFFWTAQYVGYYSAASTLALYTLLIPRMFIGSLLVSMSELHALQDYNRIVSGCRKATRYLILMVTPVVVALCCFSPVLLTTLFPKDFEIGVPVLILLSLAYWAQGVSWSCTAVLIGINAPRQLTVNTSSMVLLFGTLLFILVPIFNIVGGGLASLVIIPIQMVLFWQVARTITRRGRPTHVLEVFPLTTVFKTLGASVLAVAATGLALLGFKPLFDALLPELSFKLVIVAVGGIVGGPVYFLSLAFLVRELDAEDWRLVNRIGNLQRFTTRFSRKRPELVEKEIDLEALTEASSIGKGD